LQAGGHRFDPGYLHHEGGTSPGGPGEDNSLFDNCIGDKKASIFELLEYKLLAEFGQATKGIWWMPWRLEAMKDVVSCEKLRGGANNHRSGDLRMGQPGRGNALPSGY
jgi:hypothetical protein